MTTSKLEILSGLDKMTQKAEGAVESFLFKYEQKDDSSDQNAGTVSSSNIVTIDTSNSNN